jgi:hypothetical protein
LGVGRGIIWEKFDSASGVTVEAPAGSSVGSLSLPCFFLGSALFLGSPILRGLCRRPISQQGRDPGCFFFRRIHFLRVGEAHDDVTSSARSLKSEPPRTCDIVCRRMEPDPTDNTHAHCGLFLLGEANHLRPETSLTNHFQSAAKNYSAILLFSSSTAFFRLIFC